MVLAHHIEFGDKNGDTASRDAGSPDLMRGAQEGIVAPAAARHVSFLLGEPMRRSAYVIYAASVLLALPVSAQEKQPLLPDRPIYRPDRPDNKNTPTVTEALKALRAITVGDIRNMSDGDLRQLTDLLKQWIDIAAIEEKRRNERQERKGNKLP